MTTGIPVYPRPRVKAWLTAPYWEACADACQAQAILDPSHAAAWKTREDQARALAQSKRKEAADGRF